MELAPDSARGIFDYLSAFRLTTRRFETLLEALERFGTVYEDVEILAHEYVSVAPCLCSPALTDKIADWALEIVKREATSRPRVAASACMTLGKFGSPGHIAELARLFGTWKQDNCVAHSGDLGPLQRWQSLCERRHTITGSVATRDH